MNLTCATNSAINGEYYYIRNAQGDIIGLVDKNGTQVVTYTYDSWGKPFPEVKDANGNVLPTSGVTGTLASTVGVKNSYRYRGYRYDNETQMYYLQSRYYNPEFGRFINADGIVGQIGELLSNNMFAYCQNNCVNAYDPTGFCLMLEHEGGPVGSVYIDPAIFSSVIKSIGQTLGVIGFGHFVYSEIKKNVKNKSKKKIREDKKGHIFRDDEGHFKEDTPENRKQIEDVANDMKNWIGKDANGTDWYGKIKEDGTQIWAEVRGNEIRNAGINDSPKKWDPEVGFKTKPETMRNSK